MAKKKKEEPAVDNKVGKIKLKNKNKETVTKVNLDDFKAKPEEETVTKVDLTKKQKQMPFQSKAQMRVLYATNPKLAKKYSKKTSKKQMKNLPEKKSPKKFRVMNPLLKKLQKKK